jgi:prefoldin subunit 5
MAEIRDILQDLTDVRIQIIRKEADIESISERIAELRSTSSDDLPKAMDDLHKAKLKYKFEKERLVELKCKNAELEVDCVSFGKLGSLSNV